ncbi:MAG: AI-2E family transporter [bacterium]
MSEKHTTISISNSSIIRTVLIVLGIVGVILVKDVLITLLVAIVLASFVEVVAEKLKRKYRIPRPIVVSVVFFGLLFAIGGLLYFIIPIFFDQITTLGAQLARALPTVSWLQPFQSKGFAVGAQKFAEGIGSNASIGEVVSGSRAFLTHLSTTLFSSLSAFFNGFLHFIIILVISFYLSMQQRGVESFLRFVTPEKHEKYVVGLWERIERKIALWVQGQLLLGLIVGILVFAGLQIMGVEYSLLLALIAAIFELVPFGMIFATIPAVLLTAMNSGVSTSLIVLVLYIVIQQIENYLIAPLLVKKVVGVSPIVVIISALIGYNLIGFFGVLLAVPCAVFVIEILDDIANNRKVPIIHESN